MRVYIDKANLSSLLSNASHTMFSDCNRMLMNKFDIHFNFKKEDIENNKDIKLWMTSLTHGFKGEVKYLTDLFPERPLKSNMHNSFSRDQLSAVYMIDDERIDVIKNIGCFLIAKIGEEIDILSHLIIKDSDYSFDKKINIADLTCWGDFCDHTSPCSDIIIVDQYILSDSNIYTHNIYELIKHFSRHAKDAEVNIVIITLEKTYNKLNHSYITPNWINIQSQIKEAVKDSSGVDPNVTFILPPKNKNEHDRTIFTNYRRIYSGDSFNYFKEGNKLRTKGREVHLCSFADRDNIALGFKLVEDIQTMINSTNQRNSDLIIGDKKSNYLTF